MVIINNGFKGQVIEVNSSNPDDKDNLYKELLSARPRTIKLVTVDDEEKYIKVKIGDVNSYSKVLDYIRNAQGLLVKKFIFISIVFSSKKKSFNNELNGYKQLIKIFKNDINKYTTVKHGFTFNKKRIYGIIFKNNYYIFVEKCYKVIEDINFTQKTYDKCTNDLIEALNILNAHDYIHNDLKPNNIIQCRDRFKIIDWESSNKISKQSVSIINTKNGNLVHNHPIKFYNLGILLFMYNYIYGYELATYDYLKGLSTHKTILKIVNETFNEVLKKSQELSLIEPKELKTKKTKKTMTYNEIPEDKNYFMKLYDYYSFALTMIYIAEKNNLKYNKKLLDPILAKFMIKMI